MAAVKQTIDQVETLERYKHGFVTDIDQEFAPKGLSEATVRFISAQKNEPAWMLEWRLAAFERWLADGKNTPADLGDFPWVRTFSTFLGNTELGDLFEIDQSSRLDFKTTVNQEMRKVIIEYAKRNDGRELHVLYKH